MAESSRDSGWRDYAGWRSSGRDWAWSDGSRDSGSTWGQPLNRARREILPLYGVSLECAERRGYAEVASRNRIDENAAMRREEEFRTGRSNPKAIQRFPECQVSDKFVYSEEAQKLIHSVSGHRADCMQLRAKVHYAHMLHCFAASSGHKSQATYKSKRCTKALTKTIMAWTSRMLRLRRRRLL